MIVADNLDNIAEGDDVTITCESIGDPLPTIRWNIADEAGVLIGDSVNHTGIRNALIVERNLTVPNVSREHTGVYTCSANNSIGSDNRSIRITVQCKLHY